MDSTIFGSNTNMQFKFTAQTTLVSFCTVNINAAFLEVNSLVLLGFNVGTSTFLTD